MKIKNWLRVFWNCFKLLMTITLASVIATFFIFIVPKNLKIAILSVATDILICLLLFIFYKMGNKNLFKECKVKKIPLKLCAKAVLLGICLQFVSILVAGFSIGVLHVSTTGYASVQNDYSQMQVSILGIIGMVLIAPICEEIVCRGVLLSKCRKLVGIRGAIIIQAIFFGFLHGNIVQFIYASVLGIILGYIAYYTNSLIPTIIIHIVVNSSIFVEDLKMLQNSAIMTVLILLSIGTTAYLMYGFRMNRNNI